MNARDTATVLGALKDARHTVKNQRAEFFDSHVMRSGKSIGQVTPAERPALRAYDRTLARIDRAIAIVDPVGSMLANGCLGVAPVKGARS